MNIQHQDNTQNGSFFINDSNHQKIAELSYFWNTPNHFSIDHTWVDDSLRGQGVARLLFDAAIAFARERKVTIVPICAYADAMFRRDSSFSDVLYPAE
ncbi:GNAT family N-acetyltransferase [Acinetobacter puyangensis]|uniref:Uncharacterized protein n=1 Tax=Acinetobacter puyangensis TaxID=1096779 RepID=A0A240EDY4_9GAMM|nr:GNAT family N-acetyltransferase [Acinetobacter puyangensis]SNX46399.1 hypothetical protein SAMN05421731_11148 [Acinetobacter puyangensis]